MKWVQWQPSMMPPVQLQKASRGKPIALHFICRNGGKFLLQPWPPPDPFLVLGDLFNLCGNQLVVECGGLQPKPPWSLVFPEDDSTNYDPSKHVWLLLLDSGKIQTLLLSSIQVKMHSSVHEMIVININLQLVWHLSATKQYAVMVLDCSVHWLSLECSNGTGLLVPQPWPPPRVILCWMICRILDQCRWNYCHLSVTSSAGASSPAMQTNVANINWLGGKQASRVDSPSQIAAHAYHPSHNFDAAGTAMNFAPSCRPWKCGYLLRPLATFKLSTWASELKVADSLAYAQRGWVNVDLDKIEWESCCAYLIFKALTSWFPIEVANAGESFAEQLDAAHQNSCPWRGNNCADSLVQLHLTQSALIGGFKDCCDGLLQFTSLPVIAPSAIENMKLTRSAQIDRLLSQSITFLSGILGCRAESTAGIDIHQDFSCSYSQVC